MGNQKSVKSNKPKSDRLIIQPKISRRQLEFQFESIELDFKRIDGRINRTEKLLNLCYESFLLNFNKSLVKENELIEIIKEQRNELIRKLLMTDKLYTFLPSNISIDEFLFERYYSMLNPEWNIYAKLKYFKLFSNYQTVNISPAIENCDCYNYIVIPISRRKFFICMGLFYKRSFLKITDHLGKELRRREIHKSCYYRQFLAYGKFIVGLYEISGKATNLIEIYDDQLRVLKSKIFDHKVELVLMNSQEIICRSCMDRNLFFFLDFNLTQVFSLSIHHMSELTLLGADQNDVIVLVKHANSIRKLQRKTGLIDCVIDLNSIGSRISAVRLDADFNIVIKSNETNSLGAVNFDMSLKQQLNNFPAIRNFHQLDFTQFNDLYYCDALNKIVYFL